MVDDVTGEPLTVRMRSSELGTEAALAARRELEKAEAAPLVAKLEEEELVHRVDASRSVKAVHVAVLGALRSRRVATSACGA